MKYKPVLKQATAGAIGITLAVVLNNGLAAEGDEVVVTADDATTTDVETTTEVIADGETSTDEVAQEEAPADTGSLASDTLALTNLFSKTNGANWTASSDWTVNGDVCSWQGVACNPENSRVTKLALGGRNLSGDLPAELGQLTALTHLVLNANELTGSIPDELANLINLQDLELDDNRLSGSVPTALGNLADLNVLNLQKNQLTGDVAALAKLAETATVDLSVNGLYSKDDNLQAELGDEQTLDAEVINVSVDRRYADVTWVPVSYKQAGGYIVEFKQDGVVAVSKTLTSKDANTAQVEGLQPGFEYEVDVRSYTDIHAVLSPRVSDDNKNRVESDGEFFDAYMVTMLDSDSDQDGYGDNMEGANEVPPTDTDGDGIPDFQDQDDDNDGVLTKDEFDGDTDGDGIPNRLDDDDDGDGIKTQNETPFGDTDKDGIDDYLDNDDDNDTVLTIDELDEDTDKDNLPNYRDDNDDGDSIATADEAPPLDAEDDGILDYLQAEAVAGDADERGLETVITSRGGGAMGGGLFLLLLAGMVRRLSKRDATLALALIAAVFAVPAAADNHDEKKEMKNTAVFDGKSDDRSGRFYIGLSGGLTDLDPETKDTTHTVDDGDDFGVKLTLGYEITEYVALELFASQLGEADLTPAATVDYENFGLGVAINPMAKAGGFTPLLHLGIDRISNSSKGVNYKRDEDYLGYAGLSLQYEFPNAFAIRGTYDYFAEDAQMLSLGVFKHFGGAPPAPMIVQQPQAMPTPVIIRTQPAPAPAPAPVQNIQPVLHIPDSDGDGVSDIGDKCPNSPPGAKIDVYGCALFQGVLQGVNFEYDSAMLTGPAKAILDNVAAELSEFPKIKVEVQAHTDSKGKDQYNQRLSEKRARSVVNYLGRNGIRAARLIPVGYGERRPIATNVNEAGRAKNRRVEFQVR